MTKEQFEFFLKETRDYPYFSAIYDIDMWREDKKEIEEALELAERIKKGEIVL